MSKQHGDKARYGRLRKEGIARREKLRLLRKQLAEAKSAAPAAAKP